jgi:threonine/homoserine/homoserine lactone efflux protein
VTALLVPAVLLSPGLVLLALAAEGIRHSRKETDR